MNRVDHDVTRILEASGAGDELLAVHEVLGIAPATVRRATLQPGLKKGILSDHR